MAILNNGTWITMFEYIPSNQSIQFETTDVLWSAGVTSPPKGRPPCGWNEELCPINSKLNLVVPHVYRKSSSFFSDIIVTVTFHHTQPQIINLKEIRSSIEICFVVNCVNQNNLFVTTKRYHLSLS